MNEMAGFGGLLAGAFDEALAEKLFADDVVLLVDNFDAVRVLGAAFD